MKLKLRNKRFLQYQIEFYQQKELGLSARELYSFIYKHCIEFHDQGWCGLSNEKLAEYLKCTTRTIENNLKELKDKDMIIIENAGKRTKKTGESRQIHINAKNYIATEINESEPTGADTELLKIIERQSKEIAEMQKELNQLNFKLSQTTHITELGHSLIRTGFITEEQYQKQAEELNHILLDFESWHKEGRDLTKACFNYWNTHKDSYIKNPIQYVLKCIDQSKKWINQKNRTVEEYADEMRKTFEKWEGQINE